MNSAFLLEGRFSGEGRNHENQTFRATFDAKPIVNGGGFAFQFEAVGDDGTPYHTESSLLGLNARGGLSLWVLSSNHPGVFERPLKCSDLNEKGHGSYVFAFGDPKDTMNFREEIVLDVKEDSIRYVYSWGLPGGDFAERSACLLTRS